MHITRAQSFCLAHVHLSPWNFVAELIANICDLFPFSNTITLCLINLPASLICFRTLPIVARRIFSVVCNHSTWTRNDISDSAYVRQSRFSTTQTPKRKSTNQPEKQLIYSLSFGPSTRQQNVIEKSGGYKAIFEHHPAQCPSTAVYTYCKADAATLYPQFHKRHGKSTRRAHRIFGIAAFCTFRSWQLSGVGGARHFESYLSHLV